MTDNNSMTACVCLSGFLRQGDTEDRPAFLMQAFKGMPMYIRMPSIAYEDKPDKLLTEEGIRILYKDAQINAISVSPYDRESFKRMVPKYCERFNKFNQSAYRIYSQLFSISEVCKMALASDKKYSYYIITRPDNKIQSFDHKSVEDILKNNPTSIIVESIAEPNGYDDKIFVVPSTQLVSFSKIFDFLTTYLFQYYNPTLFKSKPDTWRPEDLWHYHLQQMNIPVALFKDIWEVIFEHQCSAECGHFFLVNPDKKTMEIKEYNQKINKL
jgi:hypothetical protein